MYHVDRDEQGKKKAKEVVQTGQGSLDRLVALDGRPLTANEQQQENKRIESLVKNPQEQQRLEQTKRKDAEQCKAFFQMIPNVFTFSYAGREGDLIELSYKPNPNFQPPSREARVFHEMEGEMWVHETQRRLVRLRGQLIADVKFAGGLLGHLEKGGHFNVEQTELLPTRWELTVMEVEEGVLGEIVHVESFLGYDLSGPFGEPILADQAHWVRQLPGGLLQNILDHLLNKITEFIIEERPIVYAHACTRSDPFNAYIGIPVEFRVMNMGDTYL